MKFGDIVDKINIYGDIAVFRLLVEKTEDLGNDLVELDVFDGAVYMPGKTEQPFGDCAAAFDRGQDRIDQFDDPGILGKSLE